MPDTKYYQGTRWPIADGSVDLVLCTETLEHVPEPSGFLDEAFRCLTHDGRLLVTVPFSARWHYIPHDYWHVHALGLGTVALGRGFRKHRRLRRVTVDGGLL